MKKQFLLTALIAVTTFSTQTFAASSWQIVAMGVIDALLTNAASSAHSSLSPHQQILACGAVGGIIGSQLAFATHSLMDIHEPKCLTRIERIARNHFYIDRTREAVVTGALIGAGLYGSLALLDPELIKPGFLVAALAVYKSSKRITTRQFELEKRRYREDYESRDEETKKIEAYLFGSDFDYKKMTEDEKFFFIKEKQKRDRQKALEELDSESNA